METHWDPIGHTIISKEFSTQISQFKSNTLSRKHIPNTKSVIMQPLTRPNSKSFRYQYLINHYSKSSDWTTRNFCTGNILCDIIIVHHKRFVRRAIPSWIISRRTAIVPTLTTTSPKARCTARVGWYPWLVDCDPIQSAGLAGVSSGMGLDDGLLVCTLLLLI